MTAPTVPKSLEAEQGLLGAIILESDLIATVIDHVTAAAFFDPVHQRIFEACRKRFVAGGIVDPIMLAADLSGDAGIAELGGAANYIGTLVVQACDPSTLPDYARMIRDLHRRRELLLISDELTRAVRQPHADGGSVDEIVARHEAALAGLALSGPKSGASFVGLAAQARLKELRAEVPTGPRITTAIPELDDALGPLGPGDLWVLGARPAMGKTAVSCTVAVNVAKQGLGVVFFCLDMAAPAMTDRLLSMLVENSRIEYRDIGRGKLRADQHEALDDAARALGELPIIIDDRRGRTPDDIASAVRRHKASLERRGVRLGLVIIDHLQKITPTRQRDSVSNEATETVRRLKNDALAAGAPYLVCSQLSRAVEQRDDKRPRLSDLRDSGAIEEEADLVSFLYREAYYLEAEKPTDVEKLEAWQGRMTACKNRLEVLQGKVRQGNRQAVKLFCDIATNRITSLQPEDLF